MDPSLSLRTITDDEFLEYGRAMERVFLESPSDEELERWRPACDIDRFLTVVTPGGAHVGTAGTHVMDMSMPGAAAVPCAAVTAITVRPDHRRRGVLRTMMQRLLDDAVAAGEPVAALFASEGTIYGRFGFGPAAPAEGLTISREALGTIWGDVTLVELVDADRARSELPVIADGHGRLRGGLLLRNDAWYRLWLDHHRDRPRDGSGGARWHAIVPGRGSVVFRGNDGDWAHRRPDGTVKIEELVANDHEAAAALWSFVASIDLTATVEARYRPVDDPVRFLVANEATIDTRPGMPLWLRLVDLPAALTARGYDATDRVVLEVHDEQVTTNAGRWSLEVSPDGSTCTHTDDDADVTLHASTLATLFLGGYRATMLADAGRLTGAAPGVVRRLDRLFSVARSPWTSFDF
jgi:predicted acetyltransferase